MKSNKIFFKNSKILPVDKFFKNVLYDKKFGYYTSRIPFGKTGDFVTAPKISNIFSEIIAIWIVTCWELFGKPRSFNIVELGPGDGSLSSVLVESFKKFPEFNSIKKLFLYEESKYLEKIQKKKYTKVLNGLITLTKLIKVQLYFLEMSFLMQFLLNNLKRLIIRYLKKIIL